MSYLSIFTFIFFCIIIRPLLAPVIIGQQCSLQICMPSKAESEILLVIVHTNTLLLFILWSFLLLHIHLLLDFFSLSLSLSFCCDSATAAVSLTNCILVINTWPTGGRAWNDDAVA